MTIKYISLLSLFVVTGANAIMPEEIIDVAYNRYARAHQDLLKCQQTKYRFGRPYKCINEHNEVTARTDEYHKVMSNMKDILNTTVQQGEKANLFERSKKRKAEIAKKTIDKITAYEQQPKELGMGRFSQDILYTSSTPCNSSDVKLYNDLYNSIPCHYEYDFIHTY